MLPKSSSSSTLPSPTTLLHAGLQTAFLILFLSTRNPGYVVLGLVCAATWGAVQWMDKISRVEAEVERLRRERVRRERGG
ncbi:hypothetical protein B9Z19DRAFT_1082193 [Tuber borchii]|uniref:Uncharacterized protein n=1 Tax=Tuber borchii TaxID=42251 RepID=A0A2T6ZUS5_TUBBO|nr:hypothetical protein B9Z19DRAFT_1082193 [Tuber borchii]